MPIYGRVAVVAGASGGIGSATVRAFLAEGVHVVAAAPQDALLDALARELAPFGERALVVPADITRRADVDALVARALVRFGRVDVLANVAGIGSSPSLCDSTDDELERVLAVNLLGAARLMHAVLPVMKAQRSGTIVNVGSVAGEAAVMGIYSASKFGLRGLNDSVRREVRRFGIGVTLIEPGFVQTPMNPAMSNLPGPEVVAEAIVAAVGAAAPPADRPGALPAAGVLGEDVPRLHRSRVRRRARPAAAQPRRARGPQGGGIVSGHRREAVVVTGASSGIGAAAAALLAREGIIVYAGVRSDADAARVATLHDNVHPLRLDVTDRAQIDAAAATVAASGHALARAGRQRRDRGRGTAGVPARGRSAPPVRHQRVRRARRRAGVSPAAARVARARRAGRLDLGPVVGAVHRAVQRLEVRVARAQRRAARGAAAGGDRRLADRAGLGEDADLAEGSRLARDAAVAHAAAGDGAVRQADRSALRRDRARGAFRDAGRAGQPRDPARAHGAQTAPELSARRPGTPRQHRGDPAGRVARPRAASLDAPAVA